MSLMFEGGFGEIYSNDDKVIKSITIWSTELEDFMERELEIMTAFSGEYDVMGIREEGCYYSKQVEIVQQQPVYVKRVKLIMDKAETSLGDMLKTQSDIHLIHNPIW